MGKTQFCRICRTAENLKYTTKELRQLNKEQLLLAQATQQGQANNKASKKLLLTTPTLGNICQICNERIQIFHRLDEGGQESSSDVEIEVVSKSVPINMAEDFTNRDADQRMERPETPVIVDDDDMLFNIFMQKFDQKTQLPLNQICSFSQQQMHKQLTNQFHSTYTPPQSTGGSSEGDESKVIEVLTSRESSPAPMRPAVACNSKLVDSQGHRIVAIIELDDDDEKQECVKQNQLHTVDKGSISNDFSDDQNGLSRSVSLPSFTNPFKDSDTSQSVYVDDDEEIVFRKVDIEKEKSPVIKKRERKTYDDKKLRLVACLDLVSSDSETDDRSLTEQFENVSNAKLTVPLTPKKTFPCNVCEQKFPDSESLSVHERVHQGVKCTLCLIGFQQVKRLIHHMRRKHREYNGDVLSEKPRSGQDSCMTIRLRYMQQTTFYECQLCGRIDDVFREHKEHILEKHPNESKSLKDPIMKQLKCPVCKIKCGIQYLSLCRHLINSHEYQEYKSHLRELVHVSAFGWNTTRQQEVAKTAKIFQFIKRKTFFFECKICSKIVAGYLHHLRHVNEHKKTSDIKDKISKEILKRSPSLASSNTSNLDKLCTTLNKDGVCLSKKLRTRDNLSQKLVSHTNIKTKLGPLEKVVKMSKKSQKPDENCGKTKKFKPNLSQNAKNSVKVVSSKQSKVESTTAISNKIQLKNECKPKDKKVVKLTNCGVSAKGKLKKESDKKSNNLKKLNSKMKLIEVKPQKKKVKVKAKTRQIDLQSYKCKYCLKKFKGFRLYNLHLLTQHKENEFSMCNNCNKFFTSAFSFEEHMKQCPQALSASKRKRKFPEPASLSENINESIPHSNKVPHTSDVSSTYLEDNYLWLRDLLKLSKPPDMNHSNLTSQQTTKTAFLNFQCCYCLHFLSNEENLKEHKEIHHLQTSDILIKYKPLKDL